MTKGFWCKYCDYLRRSCYWLLVGFPKDVRTPEIHILSWAGLRWLGWVPLGDKRPHEIKGAGNSLEVQPLLLYPILPCQSLGTVNLCHSPLPVWQDQSPNSPGLDDTLQKMMCSWPQRRRDGSMCSMTAGSSSGAWSGTSGPKAGTTGRSPGAPTRWGHLVFWDLSWRDGQGGLWGSSLSLWVLGKRKCEECNLEVENKPVSVMDRQIADTRGSQT